ncbi:MAG: replication-associated recombination protein A, partial [Deltaproteobacteria bacterium]|nr:replication-associated recombination protein A [Deltaproteobacteria bacterium]
MSHDSLSVMDLFDNAPPSGPPEPAGHAPLAERMRPRVLDELAGQARLLGPGAPLRLLLETKQIPSMIFWGPPGCGKTTVARLIAREIGAHFEASSAVLAGVKEIRRIVADAERLLRSRSRRTVLFLDEIHRFNKAQQDVLLPHVERGTLLLLGATTENPSFEINPALLSRCRVFTLEPLTEADLEAILRRALDDEARGLGARGVRAAPEAIALIVALAGGDARRALSLLDEAVSILSPEGGGSVALGHETVRQVLERGPLIYDKGGEYHYDVISAFIKSLRGSDPDAAIYWLARMLDAGEDPVFIARRMVIFAAEDVGNADAGALRTAVAAVEAVRLVGMPEGRIPLAQAATYLASAPKSNASYVAINRAEAALR